MSKHFDVNDRVRFIGRDDLNKQGGWIVDAFDLSQHMYCVMNENSGVIERVEADEIELVEPAGCVILEDYKELGNMILDGLYLICLQDAPHVKEGKALKITEVRGDGKLRAVDSLYQPEWFTIDIAMLKTAIREDRYEFAFEGFYWRGAESPHNSEVFEVCRYCEGLVEEAEPWEPMNGDIGGCVYCGRRVTSFRS
jgi:hypothetical protein